MHIVYIHITCKHDHLSMMISGKVAQLCTNQMGLVTRGDTIYVVHLPAKCWIGLAIAQWVFPRCFYHFPGKCFAHGLNGNARRATWGKHGLIMTRGPHVHEKALRGILSGCAVMRTEPSRRGTSEASSSSRLPDELKVAGSIRGLPHEFKVTESVSRLPNEFE
jgi:hypothetical protein